MPLPFGAAENVLGASFVPFGMVTVWMMSRPPDDVGKPENWKMKLVPRLPRVGTAWILGAACGGGGGGGLVGAGGAGAAVVGAAVGVGAIVAERAADAAADARGDELEEVAAVSGVTSHEAQATPARTSAAMSFIRHHVRERGPVPASGTFAVFACVFGLLCVRTVVLEHFQARTSGPAAEGSGGRDV